MRKLALAALAVITAVLPVRAEVSVSLLGSTSDLVVIFGSNNDSPFPTWARVRDYLVNDEILNPLGDSHFDGPPTSDLDPIDRTPYVVWHATTPTSTEIAISHWTGTNWSNIELLTSSPDDDLDPHIEIGADGRQYIVWWRRGATDEVWLLSRPANGSSGSEVVSQAAEAASHPTVALLGANEYIAYQRQVGPANAIVVVRRQGAVWIPTTVGTTGYTGPAGDGNVQPQVHSRGGKLWVDWLQADGLVGFSAYDPLSGLWSEPQYEPWTADPAIGVGGITAREFARGRIARQVMQP